MHLARLLLGKPLATGAADEQRIGPLVGVPVLGLDALASAAYGPEALLTVLLPLGVGALDYSSHLTALIGGLLVMVYLSYRQTIAAYPSGGGAYQVAKENLGRVPALFAASALALDYVLNVAVAIAAGVGALVSAAPRLLPHTLSLCLLLLLVLMLINLRGVRATGLTLALPTWLFVVSLLGVLGAGLWKVAFTAGHVAAVVTPRRAPTTLAAPSLWMLMHAFASGCTAMTGVEAVSNAVPIFREPTVVGARRTLSTIVSILLLLLAAEATLAVFYRVTATVPGQPGFQSLLSQLVAAVVGRGLVYYVTLGSVVTVLCLSANTSFADFPRLCRMLAEDQFLPEAFAHQGRRLVFSHGILVLSALAAGLLIVFRGITDALIPLFAVGAFLAFTMSQAGMVVHWWRRRQQRIWHALTLNAIGATATAVATLIIVSAKLREGAWISLLVMAVTLLVLEGTGRHFAFLNRAVATPASLDLGPVRPPLAVVPLRRWDAVALKAVRLALSLAPDVICVQVRTDRETDDLRSTWHDLVVKPAQERSFRAPQLVVLRSEYRALFAPLLEYVRRLEREHPDRQIAVVIPELVEQRWYHALLHNHHASLIKALLLFRGGPQIVIVSAPWYLRDWVPERRWLRRHNR